MRRYLDDLHKESWDFWYEEEKNTLFLYSYTLWHRENTEAPWVVEKTFDKVNPIQATVPFSEVPFEESIKYLARQAFKVELWNSSRGI